MACKGAKALAGVLVSLVVLGGYPSQVRPVLVHWLQLGRVSSHLIRRMLRDGEH